MTTDGFCQQAINTWHCPYNQSRSGVNAFNPITDEPAQASSGLWDLNYRSVPASPLCHVSLLWHVIIPPEPHCPDVTSVQLSGNEWPVTSQTGNILTKATFEYRAHSSGLLWPQPRPQLILSPLCQASWAECRNGTLDTREFVQMLRGNVWNRTDTHFSH